MKLLLVLILGFVLGFLVQKYLVTKKKRLNSCVSVNSFAAQIFHDLQSPLSALRFLIRSSEAIDEVTKCHLTEIDQHLRKISERLQSQISGNPSLVRQGSFDEASKEATSEGQDWKLTRIQITLPGHFVILDDQAFAHDQWEYRLKQSLRVEQEKQLIRHHLRSHAEFMKWYQDHDYGSLENALYLFDMDLGKDAPETGLDLIDRLNLQKRAILVTNQAEDPRIQNLCASRKVHLLAKSEILDVPLSMS